MSKKKRGLAILLPDKDIKNVTSKLFVYGIFLGERMRNGYNLKNPRYATVKGYITVGDYIAQAVPVKSEDIVLTGLICDVDDLTGLRNNWEHLDSLESNYDRIRVKTTNNEECWMYAAIRKDNE